MTDDRELWERIGRGDAGAFDEFYRAHAAPLQSFLRLIIGNTQAAEDVAQETFTQMWQRPNGFHPEQGTLRSYLYGIARHRAMEWWRTRRPSEAISEEILLAEAAEATSLVNDALRRLPEEQRSLLWLREVDGQSYAELAVILGVPVGTVRSRLFTAREELRRIWSGGRPRPGSKDRL